MSQYQIGDTANGYVLTPQGWAPAPATTDNTWSIISILGVAAGWTIAPFFGFLIGVLALSQARTRGEPLSGRAHAIYWGSVLIYVGLALLVGLAILIGVMNG